MDGLSSYPCISSYLDAKLGKKEASRLPLLLMVRQVKAQRLVSSKKDTKIPVFQKEVGLFTLRFHHMLACWSPLSLKMALLSVLGVT